MKVEKIKTLEVVNVKAIKRNLEGFEKSLIFLDGLYQYMLPRGKKKKFQEKRRVNIAIGAL